MEIWTIYSDPTNKERAVYHCATQPRHRRHNSINKLHVRLSLPYPTEALFAYFALHEASQSAPAKATFVPTNRVFYSQIDPLGFPLCVSLCLFGNAFILTDTHQVSALINLSMFVFRFHQTTSQVFIILSKTPLSITDCDYGYLIIVFYTGWSS